ncbi:hypothetical protein LINGRAHAP2_LOCUS23468 [Linum grandiflorum]
MGSRNPPPYEPNSSLVRNL